MEYRSIRQISEKWGISVRRIQVLCVENRIPGAVKIGYSWVIPADAEKGGQCACIVPDGVLFGSSSAHKSIRKELIENHQLRAVISMPSGVFKPYAGVSTAVLVFTKTGAGGTDKVWFYDMKADGFSLDDKRSEIADNDIPDIIQRFRHLEQEATRERTEQSFFVPKQELVDNGYDLSINKYKKTEYVAVEYPPTSEILDELEKLNEQINAETKALRALLGE